MTVTRRIGCDTCAGTAPRRTSPTLRTATARTVPAPSGLVMIGTTCRPVVRGSGRKDKCADCRGERQEKSETLSVKSRGVDDGRAACPTRETRRAVALRHPLRRDPGQRDPRSSGRPDVYSVGRSRSTSRRSVAIRPCTLDEACTGTTTLEVDPDASRIGRRPSGEGVAADGYGRGTHVEPPRRADQLTSGSSTLRVATAVPEVRRPNAVVLRRRRKK